LHHTLFIEESGDVLGIVTQKATGLTNAFDDLLMAFSEAISILYGASFFKYDEPSDGFHSTRRGWW
jgi:hypothetical protein